MQKWKIIFIWWYTILYNSAHYSDQSLLLVRNWKFVLLFEYINKMIKCFDDWLLYYIRQESRFWHLQKHNKVNIKKNAPISNFDRTWLALTVLQSNHAWMHICHWHNHQHRLHINNVQFVIWIEYVVLSACLECGTLLLTVLKEKSRNFKICVCTVPDAKNNKYLHNKCISE